MRRIARRFAIAFSLAAVAVVSSAHAVMLYSTGDRNTAAPTGSLANSGWQWTGKFSGFSATIISKKYIITAGHFNAAVGNNLIEPNGTLHRTTDMWDDPDSDLRIYKCVGTFTSWAPLWKEGNEVNRSVVLFGRGTQRGDEVRVNNELKGWKWGTEDGVQSWGRNGISEVLDGGEGISDVLKMTFDAQYGSSAEGHLSRGDSGGGVFAKRGTAWTLMGVNYSTDGPYSLTTNGTTFEAAIFDQGGLWSEATGMVNNQAKNIAGASYATRLSARINWVSDVFDGRIPPSTPQGGPPTSGGGLPVPEPAGATLVAVAAMLGLRRRSWSK